MKYRKRPTFVEAWQYNKAYDFTDRPNWVAEAINASVITFAGLDMRDLSVRFSISSHMIAQVGDWLVREEDGSIRPFTDEQFREQFEAVSGSS
jgi:hypothetical protein